MDALAYPYGEASYAQRSAGKLTVGVASRREGIAIRVYRNTAKKNGKSKGRCLRQGFANAVKMLLEGYTDVAIQSILGVGSGFISKWKKVFFQQGVEGLKLGYKGSQGFGNPQQRASVIQWLKTKEKWNLSLIDTTGDNGYIDRSSGFTKNYRTEYLMPPPEVMITSHFPKDPAWQLGSNPLPLGEFLRQPIMKPKFFADGLQLVSPVRSQTNVGDEALRNIECIPVR